MVPNLNMKVFAMLEKASADALAKAERYLQETEELLKNLGGKD